MIDLPTPIIIRPVEGGLWGNAELQMERLGLPRAVRRAVLAEFRRVVGSKPAIVKATLDDLAKYAGEPALGTFPFPMFSPVSSAAPGMTYSFEGYTLDNSNLTTYTFTNKNVGAAGTGRLIALAIQTRNTAINTARSVTSATCNGNAMTAGPTIGASSSPGYATIAWYYIVEASGTTATFVVTFNNGTQNCAIATYRLFPVSSTPVDTATATGTPSATMTDLEVKTQGLALIMVDTGRSSPALGSNYSWSGVDVPVHDLTDQINDQSGGLSLFSIPTTENNTTRDFTATDSGDVIDIAGMSFQ